MLFDLVSLSDMLDSLSLSHDPVDVSPGVDSPDEVSLCQPGSDTSDCSSGDCDNFPLTESPDEQPLQQPYRDVGVSPMTPVTLPSTLKRAVRDTVMNHPSVFDHFAAQTSKLDVAPESSVPVSAMFVPVSQNAPIVAAPPRPDDWFESSSSPDICWPPFSPPSTPDTSACEAAVQQVATAVCPSLSQHVEVQPISNPPVNSVRAQPARACKRAPDLPREPASPVPKRHSVENVVTVFSFTFIGFLLTTFLFVKYSFLSFFLTS